MTRIINTNLIKDKIKELCLESNFDLNNDLLSEIKSSIDKEKDQHAKNNLNILIENASIAKDKNIALCQDTGIVFVFIKIGQDVHLEGIDIKNAINEGIKEAYEEGCLRKSIVLDPLNRTNTNTNTPAIIHTEIVSGDKLKITVLTKGGGAENKSKLFMLKPIQGKEDIRKLVIDTVNEAGASACPPLIVGIGIGGTFDTVALLAKKALLRKLNTPNKNLFYKEFEEELLNDLNKLNIGPLGLGGNTTSFTVHIETAPCHIASLPLAINIQCHSHRCKKCEL